MATSPYHHAPRTSVALLILLERALDMLDYPVLLVDREARIEFHNRLAGSLLHDESSPLCSAGGALSLRSRDGRATLRKSIGTACAHGRPQALRVPYRDVATPRWLRLVIAPLHTSDSSGCVAVWVVNGPAAGIPREQTLSVLFGLSPAEARLARGLLVGRTPEEQARHAGVGLATVRTQLHSIFSKTGTRRQAELIALLARVPALELSES